MVDLAALVVACGPLAASHQIVILGELRGVLLWILWLLATIKRARIKVVVVLHSLARLLPAAGA
jgi:hypothetical protein